MKINGNQHPALIAIRILPSLYPPSLWSRHVCREVPAKRKGFRRLMLPIVRQPGTFSERVLVAKCVPASSPRPPDNGDDKRCLNCALTPPPHTHAHTVLVQYDSANGKKCKKTTNRPHISLAKRYTTMHLRTVASTYTAHKSSPPSQ